ncbi:MAG TPA: deaminase [Candidatus Paceibacterota bacterium]|nr:deaminase [Candidatus Paceibacterota bacterium]
MKEAIVCYVPVIHRSYQEFFNRYPKVDIFLVTQNLIISLDSDKAEKMKRNIHALEVADIQQMLALHYGPHRRVKIINSISDLDTFQKLIMPDEDISDLILKFITKEKFEILIENRFLRYDWKAATAIKTVDPDTEVTSDEMHQSFMLLAKQVSQKSSDWWRQIGVAVVCSDGTVLTAFNEHMPHADSVNIFGDPRSNLNAGELPNVCTAIHGEASIIADAARQKGVSTDGASMYVTTFPCLVCARFIRKAGIKVLYYSEGYSRLDAKEILQAHGVKLVKVV